MARRKNLKKGTFTNKMYFKGVMRGLMLALGRVKNSLRRTRNRPRRRRFRRGRRFRRWRRR